MSIPLSAFIITLNEEDRISAAISSIKEWVAEVVVIDSGSSDNTVSIAESLGACVMHNEWQGYGLQKRFAEDQCAHNWILNIDADERVSPELATEIQSLMATTEPPHACYHIDIKDQFAHESSPAPWAYSYRQIRLYNKSIARFSDSPVHDTVRPPVHCSIGNLQGIIAHRSLRNLSHATGKSNYYSNMQRDDMIKRNKHIAPWRLLTEFPLAFCKSYFVRRNIMYGWWGVVLAMNYGWSRFLRVAKMYEHSLGSKD